MLYLGCCTTGIWKLRDLAGYPQTLGVSLRGTFFLSKWNDEDKNHPKFQINQSNTSFLTTQQYYNQGWNRYKKNQVVYWVTISKYGSGTAPCQTLPENTCITGKVIHRHKSFEYVSNKTSNFPWPKNFSAFQHMTSFNSINIPFDADLIPLSGRVLRSTCLYSQSDSSTFSMPNYNRVSLQVTGKQSRDRPGLVVPSCKGCFMQRLSFPGLGTDNSKK